MTPSEIVWLITGAQLGVMLCVVASAVSTVRLNRRTETHAEATTAKARKYLATDGWRALLGSGDAQ
ncbi:hypothetical protein [Streptomyces sp. NBC_01264]|uniref:hypothetical protein n=1 Tax=Streptomyces sp. NBC_01264 TaxID=2903804 RepID=UPI00225B007D|nr:hypothetical protein [Streptomyces sp. NBC_01264]MCX4780082.1 hypothetical protein [Streptomyces sp. NBC_01264]